MTIDAARTVHAQQALHLSELLTLKFADQSFGNGRKLEVAAPDGPSTDGGRKARQSIVLQSPDTKALVIGWLDVAQKAAEIKPFDLVSTQFSQRFKEDLDVPREAYDALTGEMETFLKNQGLDVRIASASPPPRASSQPASTAARTPVAASEPNVVLWAGLGFAVGFLTCLVLVKLGVF